MSGENGAPDQSTPMKVLAGVASAAAPMKAEIRFAGRVAHLRDIPRQRAIAPRAKTSSSTGNWPWVTPMLSITPGTSPRQTWARERAPSSTGNANEDAHPPDLLQKVGLVEDPRTLITNIPASASSSCGNRQDAPAKGVRLLFHSTS